MATASVVLSEVSVTLTDKYLYEGEHVLALFRAEGFLQSGELAATECRVICAVPGRFRDVKYDCLSTIGCGSVYEPAWACVSFVFTAPGHRLRPGCHNRAGNLSFGPFSIGLGWLASLVGFPGALSGFSYHCSDHFPVDRPISAFSCNRRAGSWLSAIARAGTTRPWPSRKPSGQRAFERRDQNAVVFQHLYIFRDALYSSTSGRRARVTPCPGLATAKYIAHRAAICVRDKVTIMSVECQSCQGKGYVVKGEQTCPTCNGSGKIKNVNLMGVSEKDLKTVLSGYLPEVQGLREAADPGEVPGLRRQRQAERLRDLREAGGAGQGGLRGLRQHLPRVQAGPCLRRLRPGRGQDLPGQSGQHGRLRRVREPERPDQGPHPLQQRAPGLRLGRRSDGQDQLDQAQRQLRSHPAQRPGVQGHRSREEPAQDKVVARSTST